jgi:hypothetical protein
MSSRKRRVRLNLEELEPRIVPATINVSSTPTLLSAIQTADSNTDASNTIVLAPGTYTLKGNTSSEIQIQNQTTTNKTLTIEGNTAQNTVIAGGTGWADRIFEIIGGKNLTVDLQNLSIKGGHAVNSGQVGNGSALGGGLLIDSGKVSLSNVAVQSNSAVGANGLAATSGRGGTGEAAQSAKGGGIYLASGTLTLKQTTLSGNKAQGGVGGKGASGSTCGRDRRARAAPATSASIGASRAARDWRAAPSAGPVIRNARRVRSISPPGDNLASGISRAGPKCGFPMPSSERWRNCCAPSKTERSRKSADATMWRRSLFVRPSTRRRASIALPRCANFCQTPVHELFTKIPGFPPPPWPIQFVSSPQSSPLMLRR